LVWSLCYLVFRCVLPLALLRPRSDAFKELELVVLRHELSVLRRQAGVHTSPRATECFWSRRVAYLPRSRRRSFGHADDADALASTPRRSPLDV
jgi:putative transposase